MRAFRGKKIIMGTFWGSGFWTKGLLIVFIRALLASTENNLIFGWKDYEGNIRNYFEEFGQLDWEEPTGLTQFWVNETFLTPRRI